MSKPAKAKERELRTANVSAWAAVFAVVVAVAGLGYQILHDRSTGASVDARFGKEDERLGKIEAGLRLLTSSVAPNLYKAMDDSLRSALSLPALEAAPKLASAAAVVQQLDRAKAKLPAATVDQTVPQLSQVAAKHSDLPETWGLIGDFISYRSQAAQTGLVQSYLPATRNQYPFPSSTSQTLQLRL